MQIADLPQCSISRSKIEQLFAEWLRKSSTNDLVS